MASRSGCLCWRGTARLRGHLDKRARTWQVRSLSSADGHKAASASIYDMAIEVIKTDGERKREELRSLREQLEKEMSHASRSHRVVELQRNINRLEVQSEINDPTTRAKFRQAIQAHESRPLQKTNKAFPVIADEPTGTQKLNLDLSQPVYRYLLKEALEKHVSFPVSRILQRVEQMRVVPDCLGLTIEELQSSLQGNLELTLDGVRVEVGSKVPLSTTQTLEQIQFDPILFHMEQRSYTLVMIDPDVPKLESQDYTTFLHMVVPNIKLSATQLSIDLRSRSPESVIPFIPPHPAKGSDFHRYTFMLFEQPEDHDIPLPVEIPNGDIYEPNLAKYRVGFNLDNYVNQHGLKTRAIHFIRAQHPAQDDPEFLGSNLAHDIVQRTYTKYYDGQIEPYFVRPKQAIRRLFRGGIPAKRYLDPSVDA